MGTIAPAWSGTLRRRIRRVGAYPRRLRIPQRLRRPMAVRRLGGPSPRWRAVLGWLAAAAFVAIIALVVGRGAGVGLPSASPTAAPGRLAILFGTTVDPATGEATTPTERFAAGDEFAYSVRLAAPAGVGSIQVEVIRLDPGGRQIVAQPPSRQGISASSRVITFRVPARALLTGFGPGSFVMRIYLGAATTPIAEGRFTLVGPVPPPS